MLIGVMEANPELVMEAASPTLLRANELSPKLIADRASSSLAGFWRSSPSRALLDSGSRTQIRNSCGWIEKRKNESKTAWEAVHRCLFPIGEMGKP